MATAATLPCDTSDPLALRERLCAPFPADVVQCRPGAASKDGKKAAAFWYIDARTVMDRLDDVFGPGRWADNYELFLERKMVVCRLSCKVDGEWVTKADVGGESEQPDEGDRHKAAFSDAIKRAAVKWGIGRYLYDIPFMMHPLSEHGKFFDRNNMPRLPTQFLPKVTTPGQAAQALAWIVENYGKAKTAQDVLRVDGVIKDRGALALLSAADVARADAARAAAWSAAGG